MYHYEIERGWDKTDTKFKVYKQEWENKLVAIFFDELDAVIFVRLKNNGDFN